MIAECVSGRYRIETRVVAVNISKAATLLLSTPLFGTYVWIMLLKGKMDTLCSCSNRGLSACLLFCWDLQSCRFREASFLSGLESLQSCISEKQYMWAAILKTLSQEEDPLITMGLPSEYKRLGLQPYSEHPGASANHPLQNFISDTAKQYQERKDVNCMLLMAVVN